MSLQGEIRHVSSDVAREGLLRLNNHSAEETSLLCLERFEQLLNWSSLKLFIPPDAALLIAFDQASLYDGANYLWFRERYRDFLYIDRVIVAQSHRRSGMGRALYAEAFNYARKVGHARIACEVNLSPPNPASESFHAELGFKEVGKATLDDGAKTVRYLVAECACG